MYPPQNERGNIGKIRKKVFLLLCVAIFYEPEGQRSCQTVSRPADVCTPGGRVNRGDLAEHMCLYSLCITVHSTTLNSCFRSKKKKKSSPRRRTWASKKVNLVLFFFFFLNPLPRLCLLILERQEGRERGREKSIDEREKLRSVASHMRLDWRIKLETQVCAQTGN